MKKFHRLLVIFPFALQAIACSSRDGELALANEPPDSSPNTGTPAPERIMTSEQSAEIAASALAKAALAKEEGPVVSPANEQGVANLPYAHGKVFHSLDDYLAHLEKLGQIDLPWWRQIRPGVYEQVTTMTGAVPEVATREELMRRYGFTR